MIELTVNENVDTLSSSLENFYNLVNRPFESISTTCKQQACLEETGFYIPPKTINIGKRDDMSNRDGKNILVQKDVTFQYVSIYETLEILLKNDLFRLEIDKYAKNNTKEGYYYEEHALFKDKKNLRILLYYDDLELCNALGDISGVYKTGMFYFTITN
jgi:hypothetical protein